MPTRSGRSGLWPFSLSLVTVWCMLSAIQSKKSVPLRFLMSLSILNESMRTMVLPQPDAPRPPKSTRATRSVDPPTSSARYRPDSRPEGNCELYDGSMQAGFDHRPSRNWRFSFRESSSSRPGLTSANKRCSACVRKSAGESAATLLGPTSWESRTTVVVVQNASSCLRKDRHRKSDLEAAMRRSRRDNMAETSGRMTPETRMNMRAGRLVFF